MLYQTIFKITGQIKIMDKIIWDRIIDKEVEVGEEGEGVILISEVIVIIIDFRIK